jgi:hypothetical protein
MEFYCPGISKKKFWEKYCPGDLYGQEINKNRSSSVSFPSGLPFFIDYLSTQQPMSQREGQVREVPLPLTDVQDYLNR